VGIAISLAALALVGRFGRAEILSSLLLSPGVVVGFLVSNRVAAVLDRGHTRSVILASSALAGVGVIVEAIVRRS
jgi:hypothetical protein